MSRGVGISLLGLGNVGGGLVRLLHTNSGLIAARSGIVLDLASIYARNPKRAEGLEITPELLTGDADEAINQPDSSIVVEVMGGIEFAENCIRRAFQAGKHVVTANKALIARRGPELLAAAAAAGVSLRYEAAVAGAIPIIRVLSEDLIGNRIRAFRGIVNGTTNYILTRMADEGMAFEAALDEARMLGFAEADPTDDIEGYDAQYKLCILSRLAFGLQIPVSPDEIYREGITGLTRADLACAHNLGYAIKLLAMAQTMEGEGGIDVSLRVHPALVPLNSALAAARGAQNVIQIEGDQVGTLLLAGSGAGAAPTASSVLADIIQIARLVENRTGIPAPSAEPRSSDASENYRLRPMAGVVCGRFLCWPDDRNASSIIRDVLARENAMISDECSDSETGSRAALIASLSETRWQEVLEGVRTALVTAGLAADQIQSIRVI